MKIFVVIACFNGEKYIDDCIHSLLQSTVPVDIVAVENASVDTTLEKLRRYEPRITVLAQKKNLGFGIGNNAGAKYAMEHGADWILWLNMDTKIDPDCIRHLMEAASSLGSSAVFCPLPKTFSQILDLGFMSNTLSPQPEKFGTRDFLTDLYEHRPLQKYYTIDQISGAAIFISSKTLRHTGGFCDLFFPAYYEDAELCRRLRYYGHILYFIPDAVFFHDVENRSSSKIPFSFFLCGQAYEDTLNPELSFAQSYCQSILLRFLKSVLFFLTLNPPRFKDEFSAFLMLVFMWARVRKKRKMVLRKESLGLKDSLDNVLFPCCLFRYIKR